MTATGTRSPDATSGFFFSSRRRHTSSLCDWSSDVCSSDLGVLVRVHTNQDAGGSAERHGLAARAEGEDGLVLSQIGRASCRERVEVLVVAVSLKRKP